MAEPLSEAEVVRQIDKLETYVKNHETSIPLRLYDAVDGASRTYIAYTTSNKKPGWASTVKQQDGSPMWSPKDAKALEELVEQSVQHQAAQKGGKQVPVPTAGPELHVTPASSLVTLPDAKTFSIDELFENVREYIKSIDTKNRELASILGPVAVVKSLSKDYTEDISMPFLFPFPPFKTNIRVPSRMVIPMIQSILETCRLLVSNSLIDIEFLRKIFSFIIAIFDITRGEWKSGLLSFMGYFGKEQMLMGQSLKTAKWIYNFISPDIQARIEDDVLDGGKSILAGSILWFVSIISPGPVQAAINNMLETAKQPVDELNKKFEEIQKTAQASAAKVGAKVVFPKFPLAQFPSFDDVQNFQSIVHQPEVFCSIKFQEVLAESIQVPVVRVLLELMNVPTLPQDVTETCRGQSATIEESLLKSMIPTVTMDDTKPQKGGDGSVTTLGTVVGVGTAALPASKQLLYTYYPDPATLVFGKLETPEEEPVQEPVQESPPLLNKETPKKIANTVGPILQTAAKGVELGAKGVSLAAKQTEFIEDKLAVLEDGLSTTESYLTGGINQSMPAVEGAVGVVRPILGPIVGTVSSTASSAASGAGNIMGAITEQFAPSITKLITAGKNIAVTTSNVASNAVTMKNAITESASPVVESATKATGEAAEYLKPSVKNVLRGTQPVVTMAQDAIVSAVDTATDEYIKPVKNTVKATIQKTGNAVGPSKNKAFEAIQASSKNIETLQNSMNKASNSGKKLGNTTAKLQSSVSKLTSTIGSIATPYPTSKSNTKNKTRKNRA